MMQKISYFAFIIVITCLIGCSASRKTFDPQHKYTQKQLQQDYGVFRSVLEESHPSLYWFTTKDSMDYYFDDGFRRISDSMTELQFRNILSYVVSKVHCGHTAVKYSKQYGRYLDTARIKMFPLSFKVWSDSLAVTANINRKDSILKFGTLVTAIDGYSVRQLTDTFMNYISGDGNSINGRYQSLSNSGAFGSLYRNVLGLKDQITVTYLDSTGIEKTVDVPVFDPAAKKKDSLEKIVKAGGQAPKPPKEVPQVRLSLSSRYVQIDTTLSSAYMTVHTFGRGNKLRSFFRKSFRELQRRNIQHLVVDVRTNGGGDAGISTLLTRYLADKKFKLADSLYAVRRSSRYHKYISWQPFYWSLMQFVTHKKKDGLYHFGYFERHYFRPKKRHHFNGDIYLVTGGNSFSATTLFVKVLQGQHNVKVIGEETGGGAYGNSAWMIPDVTLPNTKVRFRLPKFRLVMDKNLVKEGRGILPDIQVSPTRETIRRGIDPKKAVIRGMIMHKIGVAQQ
ncbi:peptidase S41 [Niastella caeni]|uniref:Peptidase S41 n=1 Tax=Niastella caeni TaxID=2569763 RepID=A0A4S8I1L2_9BACT|nr:S41 family peptidase [Niastella caeni]THU41947.1 peptidase S41 [Niastella caeni]